MLKSPGPDLLLRGGVVIDGSGGPAVRADVAVTAGRISAVGDLSAVRAKETVSVAGRVVAPGFIDVHTHDDLICLASPDMTPKISQGVTTVIVGNCGISACPIAFADTVTEPFNLLGGRDEFRFATYGDYIAAIGAARPRVNIAALVGHSTLRLRCMADLRRAADVNEIAAMAAVLDEALQAGALGLSSGVFYAPARAADVAELTALAGVVAQARGVYTAHIRDEYDGVVEALEEAFSVAAPHRVPLVISHHKCAGVCNWGRSTETLGRIDKARRRQPVYMDCYPYTAGSTVIRDDLADGEIEVLINWSEPHPEMAGRKLKCIAGDWEVSEAEAARRLAPGGASYFQIHEADMQRILCHDGCMIGSDGLPNDPLPHPRLWGTFPRVLGRYARELGLLPLEQAVHKMTGLSARTFGLEDRGLIAPGMAADITVFDAAAVLDTATYADPQAVAAGIDHVFVNGALSWSHGEAVGTRAGRFLRRGAAPAQEIAHREEVAS
ncbi:MAG: D-aminoacylase [Asticcacaulis sp.]